MAAMTVVVDGANVMGSRPDGWWRDRAGAAVRLHADIVRIAASPVAEFGEAVVGWVLVLEGAARAAVIPASEAVLPASEAVLPASQAVLPASQEVLPASEAVLPASQEVLPASQGVRVVLADGSGDDAIVALLRSVPAPCTVVTADRELRRRCTEAGASVLGPGWLLGLFRSPLHRGCVTGYVAAASADTEVSGRPTRSAGRPTSPLARHA
jgi:8-oxo-dGTP diphosphatase